MTVSGQPPGRDHLLHDHLSVEGGAPLDEATLARIATRMFNEAIDSAAGRASPVPLSAPAAPPEHPQLAPQPWAALLPPTPAGPDYYFVENPNQPPTGSTSWAAAREPEPVSSGHDFYFVEPARARETPVDRRGEGFFDVERVRRDFPILSETVNGHRLVWLDNAATTQKPQAVIDRLAWYYAHANSNVHRAAHELAARSTDAYEGARDRIARFLGASSAKEIVFVRGTTEAINLVAHAWGARNLGEGDEIILSHLEHHANIVPWQQITAKKGAHLRVIPVDDDGQLILEEFERLLSPRTRLVAVAHVSNALGTIVPIAEVVKMARAAGARVLIDGAQSVAHMKINLQEMDPDFFVFSGHKIFGPTGIGALWGKSEVLADMPPYQGGGNMIRDVTFERTLYQQPPDRFEAGTGNIADAVGLAAALDYLDQLGIENVNRYEHGLLDYATAGLDTVPGLRQIGTAPDKASILSFVLEGFTPEQVAAALDQHGIAVRAGHHCAQPILRRFGLEATVRPSLALYNTHGEVDQLVSVLTDLTRRGR